MKKARLLKPVACLLSLSLCLLAGCSGSTSLMIKPMTPAQVQAELDKAPTVNTKKVCRIAGGYWPKPPGFGGNLVGAQVGDPGYYIYESMYEYIRTTDEIIPRLATGYENEGNKTIVHLVQNRKWNDGEPFTAKDIWSYYILNFQGCELCNYLTDLKVVDDYTLEFDWADPMVSDDYKLLLFTQGWQAVFPYHIYKEYIDNAYSYIQKGAAYTGNAVTRPAFGKVFDSATEALIKRNWNKFLGSGPKMPVGTGPYMVKSVSDAQCILVKNPYYPDKDKLQFDELDMSVVSDVNSLLANNMTDSFIGTLPYDMSMQILKKSRQMVCYPIVDQSSVGCIFNTQKAPFNNKEFRQALNWVINKESVRQVSNYWGVENDIATVGILPSTLEKNLTTEALNKLQRYSCDPSKAAEMLQSMGWKKNSGGVWQDKEGKTYNFIIAANSGWGTQGINAASEIAQQLSKFGFPTEAKSVDSSVVVDRTKKGEYDMAIDFVDMTWNVSNPYSCLNTYFNDVSAEALLPRDSNDKLSLKLTDYNGQEFDVRSTVLSLRYENDPVKYKETVSRLVWAANDYAMAINLYQTVMCIWQNFTTQKGLPMEGEIASFNGMMPLPRNAEEQEQVAVLNRGYAFYAEEFVRGQVRPK